MFENLGAPDKDEVDVCVDPIIHEKQIKIIPKEVANPSKDCYKRGGEIKPIQKSVPYVPDPIVARKLKDSLLDVLNAQ